MFDYNFLYLLSPLHTGGTTQEGNLVGIARESHTNFPYIASSSIRGRLRASIGDKTLREKLFGTELPNNENKNENDPETESPNEENQNQGDRPNEFEGLKQGSIWIGDGSILWLPIPSLSHGVVWISSPLLLKRWAKFNPQLSASIPDPYTCSFVENNSTVYLKDAILRDLTQWKPENWQQFVPQAGQNTSIDRVLVLPDQHCATLIQMSLWRQVKINLKDDKTVKDGSFRYEEAIPPDTLMYFPWGINSAVKDKDTDSYGQFQKLITANKVLQIGGQESLGRGFVQQWLGNTSYQKSLET